MKDRETSERLELKILEKAMRYLPDCRRQLAIDGGANVGRWSLELAKHFAAVLAFEPVDFSYRALAERTNMAGVHNVYTFRNALFDAHQWVEMRSPAKRSASTAMFAHPVDKQTAVAVSCIPLDLLRLEDCDLLKLDLEGAELRALRGARHTLATFRPVVIVECIDKQLQRFGDSSIDLHRFMAGAGYELTLEQTPNRVYVHMRQPQ